MNWTAVTQPLNLLTFFGGFAFDILLQDFAIIVEKKRSPENYGLKEKRLLESTARLLEHKSWTHIRVA